MGEIQRRNKRLICKYFNKKETEFFFRKIIKYKNVHNKNKS